MKETTCWKTSDGELFENKDEAKIHQIEIQLKSGLIKFVDDFYCHNMHSTDIVDELYRGRFILAELLKEFPLD